MSKIEKLNKYLINWTSLSMPWTNVYGLARSILALSTAMTLAFNDARIFFRPTSDSLDYPKCENGISIFCFVPNDYIYLNATRLLCVVLLLVVASGWRPRFTGILHWWITFSFMHSATTIDGGEYVAAVITFLLIPITLTDPRKWHWSQLTFNEGITENKILYMKLIALVSLVAIRFQVAILYLHSTVAKIAQEDWVNGTAVWYYVQSPMLGLHPVMFDFFKMFLASPWIVVPTWGTIILQFFLFAALIAPKKYWRYFLILAILMHEIFAIFLGLISFSMIMFAALILYLRPVEEIFNFKGIKRIFKGKMKGLFDKEVA